MSTLKWPGETLTKMCLQMVNEQRAPDRERWQTVMTGPVPPIEMFHPSPFTEGLLDGLRLPQSVEAPITRSLTARAGDLGSGPHRAPGSRLRSHCAEPHMLLPKWAARNGNCQGWYVACLLGRCRAPKCCVPRRTARSR
jgi:hypothetical protein